jgi:hypothetical protein
MTLRATQLSTVANSNGSHRNRKGGPRTPSGKAIARMNGLKYGIYSKKPLLPTEDRRAYQRLRSGYFSYHQPVSPEEAFYVERLVEIDWRVRRLRNAEPALILDEARFLKASCELLEVRRQMADDSLPARVRKEAEIRWREHCNSSECIAVVSSPDLGRYEKRETHLTRSYDRTLNQLYKAQREGGERNRSKGAVSRSDDLADYECRPPA